MDNLVFFDRDFTGVRAVFKRVDNGRILFDGIVEEYEKDFHIFKIRPNTSDTFANIKTVEVIIHYHTGEVLYCYGTVRKTYTYGLIDVALYKNSDQDKNREFNRHSLGVPGKIDIVTVNDWDIALRRPMDVLVEDISQSGVSIRTSMDMFSVGSQFRLKLQMQQTAMDLKCTVKRVTELDIFTASYGCEFIG